VFSRREKILVALAVAVVAVVGGLQFLGTSARTAATDPGSDLPHLKALQRSVADTEARLRGITVPAPEAAARLLRAAQASGAATGVTIAFARPHPGTKTRSGCVEYALEVQATGRFPSVARFMYDLEAKNANLRIARVAITSGDAASDAVNCAITIAGYSPGAIKKWTKDEVPNRGRVPSP
jgi:hypothetical protein